MATGGSEAVFELGPMNLADLLDAVIRLYRHNFGTLVRIAAVVHVPLGVLQIASSALATGGLDFETPSPTIGTSTLIGGLGVIIYWVLFFLTMPIVQGAMARAVAQSHLGEETSVGEAYRFALRRWFNLLVATLLQGVAHVAAVGVPLLPVGVVIGADVFASGGGLPDFGIRTLVLGLAGILGALAVWTVVFVKLFFGPLTVVLEDRGPVESLSRSWGLTTGHFVRVALTMFIVVMLTVVLTYIVVIPAQLAALALQVVSAVGAQAVSGAAVMLTQVLLQPVQIVATVLIYYDLRIRKEGFDLVMMAETIDEPQLATRTASGEARPAGALYGSPPPAPASPSESATHEGASPPPLEDSLRGEKMLVIDEHRHIARLVEANLTRAGYDVMTASDVAEAIEKARTEEPDLVVYESETAWVEDLLTRLRADPETAHIRSFALADFPHFSRLRR